jgi:NTE family protein
VTQGADLVIGTSAGATTAAQVRSGIRPAELLASAADRQRAMGAFGLESDAILEPGAGQRRGTVAARLPRREWPERPMIVMAEVAALDRRDWSRRSALIPVAP